MEILTDKEFKRMFPPLSDVIEVITAIFSIFLVIIRNNICIIYLHILGYLCMTVYHLGALKNRALPGVPKDEKLPKLLRLNFKEISFTTIEHKN